MRSVLSAVVVMGLVAGCSSPPDADASPAEESAAAGDAASPSGSAPADGSASGQAPDPAAITDAEIAAVVVAANEIDAELGELAAARATDPEIREFGRAMSRDHRAVNEQAGALLARLGVTPEENEVSRGLRSDAQEFRAELESKTGAEFDRSYIAHEVEYHQAVIDALDGLLIPGATNEELRQTLESVRPSLVAHRQRAEQLHEKVR